MLVELGVVEQRYRAGNLFVAGDPARKITEQLIDDASYVPVYLGPWARVSGDLGLPLLAAKGNHFATASRS